MFEVISGGICAAKGFLAGATHCGIREGSKSNDTAVIYSEVPCTAAAVFTKNRVKASPLLVTKEHLKNGRAQGVIINSKNANACAPDGMANARREAAACAKFLNIPEEDVIVCSTGVIGQRLYVEAIEENLHLLQLKPDGSDEASRAIMTTDTTPKTAAVSFQAGGKTCHMGGICKGSGMIHPNMGTMICMITTDCAVDRELLQALLLEKVNISFNRISVDGDTSTNDTCCILANGMAANQQIKAKTDDGYENLAEALEYLCIQLARKIAADGEGATHLITCKVSGAASEADAEGLAKSVCSSSLVKAAMFGADANWGRIICAMGYSGIVFDPEKVSISFVSDAGRILVCDEGKAVDFDEDLAKKILSEFEVVIEAKVQEGTAQATAWGCDLTYDYVKINGDYRT